MGAIVGRTGDLKGIRQVLGHTQEELAGLLGISHRALQSYEQGWRPIPCRVQQTLALLLYLHYRKTAGKPPSCWRAQLRSRPAAAMPGVQPARRGCLLDDRRSAVQRHCAYRDGEDDVGLPSLPGGARLVAGRDRRPLRTSGVAAAHSFGFRRSSTIFSAIATGTAS